MDLIDFLRMLVPQDVGGVPAAGAAIGALVFSVIEVWDKLGARFGWKPSGEAKLVASLVGALLAPTVAAGLLAWQTGEALTANAAYLVVCVVGWGVAKLAHSGVEKMEKGK